VTRGQLPPEGRFARPERRWSYCHGTPFRYTPCLDKKQAKLFLL